MEMVDREAEGSDSLEVSDLVWTFAGLRIIHINVRALC